jgi:elongation factor 1-gamma
MVKDECYDVELYDWTKVDITQEDQKALVNAYFEEPDEIQGMKLLETKCFK